jgi:hypothetical protein
VLVAGDEVGGAPGELGLVGDAVGQPDVGRAIGQPLDHHGQLEAGQAIAEAEMGPEAEGDVLVGRAPDAWYLVTAYTPSGDCAPAAFGVAAGHCETSIDPARVAQLDRATAS